MRVIRVAISQLLATDVALDKLGARGISASEVKQLVGNDHVVVRNPGAGGHSDARRLLIGLTDGGRALTIVIERTVDPTTWLIVTGWSSTAIERKLLERR
ncbi:MAG: hypothetical protein QOJ35_2340 [Solirubrobacteraceae bacterium]|nr:hypothetical protein [Solirubrobacteraceae bacterium]